MTSAKLGMSTPLAKSHLFKAEDLTNGVLKSINPNGLVLDGGATAMPTSDHGPFELCEKTFLMIVLDPFQELRDADRTNNVIVIPIERDCNAFEEAEPICKVKPDYHVLGT